MEGQNSDSVSAEERYVKSPNLLHPGQMCSDKPGSQIHSIATYQQVKESGPHSKLTSRILSAHDSGTSVASGSLVLVFIVSCCCRKISFYTLYNPMHNRTSQGKQAKHALRGLHLPVPSNVCDYLFHVTLHASLKPSFQLNSPQACVANSP